MIKAIVVCAAALAVAAMASVSVAGPLDPPPGPVTATGKTLTEVDPRIAVNEVNTPGSGSARYRITAPGSYYLTHSLRNTVQQTGSMVSIEASDVTLDLSGFTIDGDEQTPAILMIGVQVGAGQSRVRIRNGVIKGCRYGVRASTASGVIVEDLRLSDIQVGVYASDDGLVRRCLVTEGRGNGVGVFVQSVEDVRISGCTVTGMSVGLESNFGVNVVVEDCAFSNCGSGVLVYLGAARVSVVNCRLRQCTTGIGNLTDAAARNNFLSNVATGCTTPYSGVPNVSTDPQAASAWANLAL